MPKHSDRTNRSDSSIPLLIAIALGFVFFGAYLAVEHFFPENTLGAFTPVLFLLCYLLLSLTVYVLFRVKRYMNRAEQSMHETLNQKMHSIFKYTVNVPYAIVEDGGRVRAINESLQHLIGAREPFYRGNISELCGDVPLSEIVAAGKRKDHNNDVSTYAEQALAIEREVTTKPPEAEFRAAEGGMVVRLATAGRYVARAYEVHLDKKTSYVVVFSDVTELLNLKEKTERDMPVVAYIDVDNLEELAQYTRVSYRDASRRVDDILVRWATEMNGLLREYERDRYIMLFSQEKLRECENDKFSRLLGGVRDIRLGEYGIPVTLSVGISLADSSMADRAADAESALDMALQRGGDQVAVRRKDGIRYYGGETRPFRKRNRVQSRVVANFLLSKISEADNLLIMGHRNPDFDSIGACIGLAQFGLFANVPTKIISDLDHTNFRTVTQRLMSSPTYANMFISASKAMDLIRPDTLLIIADANNFKIIESPELAENVQKVSGKIAIVDHHSKTGEYDFDPVISHIDSSASSTCELISEMLEQCETGSENEISRDLGDEVASVMLSGIMLDTVGFTRNTGTRTMDAARYLYGKGANAEHVQTFFNQNYEDYVCERSFAGCRFLQNNSVGLTWSHGTGRGADDRTAAAKESDRLLTVRGVHASFALVQIEEVIHISGRSDGSINVQLILERLGGGGRFDSAGAALRDTTLELAIDDLEAAINGYFEDMEDAKHTDTTI